MAEERTIGLARPSQRVGEEESKEELQRRLELARDSISHTVTEIKETVANQYQAVKDTLDWREQFKRRPIAWSAGALGAGFLVGYKVAGAFKHESYGEYSQSYGFVSQRPRAEPAMASASTSLPAQNVDEGPGLVDRIKESSAYETLSKEVSSLGNKAVEELSSTAKLIVLPFLLSKFKEWVGIDRLERSNQASTARGTGSAPRTDWTEPGKPTMRESSMGHS